MTSQFKIFPITIRLFIILSVITLANSCDPDSDDETPVPNETGTMVDIDNNEYKTVKIGNQWWMAENLKVKHYRNGEEIPEISDSDSALWKIATEGGYCIFLDVNLPPPGLLYNWYAILNSSNIAPEGWHIPSDEEWKQLEKTIGMTQEASDQLAWRGSDQGAKLKSADLNDWTQYDGMLSTNESGFTALAGSCRLFNSQWGDPGLKCTGFWWTSTAINNNEALYRYLDYKNSDVFRSHTNYRYGFSIRCVKD